MENSQKANDTPDNEMPELSAKQLMQLVEKTLDDDKAEDIVTIDLDGKSSVADYLVIASGRSVRHVSALADHVLRALREVGLGRVATEGMSSGDWILMDAGDVIVHLFRPEVREFYNLEKIWSIALPDQPDEA
ncbi:MAG: ribosome silencing factor [Robiginitomaculum sp.]|nr:MAG: ribosome silencing factor [Robiginitomaculum sp.]